MRISDWSSDVCSSDLFNETLYDGRRISTATGGRSVDFSTVGADFVGTLSVLKTPDVSLSASSIGATVNVEFPKPFDHPGKRIAVRVGLVAGRGGQDRAVDRRLVQRHLRQRYGRHPRRCRLHAPRYA